MHIDYTAKIEEVKTAPEIDGFENVVRKVLWSITFFDSEHPEEVTSVGTVESLLPCDKLDESTFISFEDITRQNILDRCLHDCGGSEFLDGLLSGGHAEILERKLTEVGLVEVDLDQIPVD